MTANYLSMIHNFTAYLVTYDMLKLFTQSLHELYINDCPKNIDPILWQAQKDAIESRIKDFKTEMFEFELSHTPTGAYYQSQNTISPTSPDNLSITI